MAGLMEERHRQVAFGLGHRKTIREIAIELELSPRTIKAYSDQLRSRLGVSSAREIPEAYMRLTGEDPFPRGEADGAAA